MTTQQKKVYRAMKQLRIESNTPGSDREAILKELEELRKSLGGMQYAPPVQEKHDTKSYHDLAGAVTKGLERFLPCPKCLRLLHYSVVDIEVGCYSCNRI